MSRIPRVIDWETGLAPDGARYEVFTEHIRGEPRAYYGMVKPLEGRATKGDRWAGWVGGWYDLNGYDVSHSEQAAKNNCDRHAARWHAGDEVVAS